MSFCYTLINPFPAEEEKEELLAAGIHLPARAGTPRCLGGDVFGDRKRLRLVREGPPLKAECCRWAEGRLLSPRTVALLAPRASDEGRLFRNPPCPAPSSRGSALTPHALQQTAQGGTQRRKGGGPSHHSSWHVPLSRDAGAKAPDTTLRHRATPKTSLPLRLPGRGRFERTLDFFVLFRF